MAGRHGGWSGSVCGGRGQDRTHMGLQMARDQKTEVTGRTRARYHLKGLTFTSQAPLPQNSVTFQVVPQAGDQVLKASAHGSVQDLGLIGRCLGRHYQSHASVSCDPVALLFLSSLPLCETEEFTASGRSGTSSHPRSLCAMNTLTAALGSWSGLHFLYLNVSSW